jgi:hypothetical protein
MKPLNQFYVDNMAARLTSEVPATTSENSPAAQPGANEGKNRKGVRPHKGAGSSDYASNLPAVVSKDSLKRKQSANDTAGVQAVRSTAYQIGQKLGIDFRRLALTDSGFKKI